MQDGGGEVRAVAKLLQLGARVARRIAEVRKERVLPNPLPNGVEPCIQPRGKTVRVWNLSCDQGLKLTSAVYI